MDTVAQLLSLICVSLFFILGISIVKKYFGVEFEDRINTAFFMLICVAVCEFVYKSVDSGTMYSGNLIEYALKSNGRAYDFVCETLGKLVFGKTDTVKLMLGTLCFGIALAECEDAVFYPFAFMCFSEGGVILLLAVSAMKYSENLMVSLVFTALAMVFDVRAAVLLVFIFMNRTKLKRYAVYFYGAAALFCGNVLFAPAYAYAVKKINDKFVSGAVKTASLVYMGYLLICAF